MLTSGRRGIIYPNTTRTDSSDVPRDIAAAIAALEVDVFYGQGLLASRPVSTSGTPGIQGRVYFATDNSTLYWDTGTSWVSVGSVSNTAIAQAILLSGTLGARPAATTNNQGFYYVATDNGILYQNISGSAWTVMLSGSSTSDSPKKLFQGLVSNVAAVVYTVPAGKQTRYETCRLFNSDTVARTVTLYDGGTAAANTILPATEIPAGEWIELDLSGMGQQAAGTIAAVSSSSGIIVMTLYGSEEDPGQRLYKKLYQGTPGNALGSILTTTARERISHIRAVNTHATLTRGLGLADGGTATTNVLQDSASPNSQIPAGGIMEIQSYLAMATTVQLYAAAQGSGTDVVLTVYGIEG